MSFLNISKMSEMQEISEVLKSNFHYNQRVAHKKSYLFLD
jgi:hypothetical protein